MQPTHQLSWSTPSRAYLTIFVSLAAIGMFDVTASGQSPPSGNAIGYPPGQIGNRSASRQPGTAPGVKTLSPISEYYPPATSSPHQFRSAPTQPPTDPRTVPANPALQVPRQYAAKPAMTESIATTAQPTPAPDAAPDAAAADSPAPLPLSRPGSPAASESTDTPKQIGSTSSQLGLTMAVLAGVIALIIVSAQFLKRHTPLSAAGLPAEALELLGRKVVDQRHAIHFVRIGSRILILGSSAEGLRTLGEITDPIEIDRIAGLCQTTPTESPFTRSFNFLLSRTREAATSVNLDQQHRQRQRERKQTTSVDQPPVFSWQAGKSSESSSISQRDIADLTRTLEDARRKEA